MAAGVPETDPYVVLGVPRTASADQVRAAYRTLGARYHPDRHQGNPLEELASAKMAEINRAYEVLSDPARRAAFDSARSSGFSPGAFPGAAAGSGFGPPQPGSRRAAKITLALVLLPVLLRLAPVILRGLVALGRELIEALTLIRGTPVALVTVALAFLILLAVLFRRHRRRRG